MGTSNIPFPSFTLVLTSGRVIIPGRSMVIRIEPPVIQNVHNNIMKTIDIHSENLVVSLQNDSTQDSAHGTPGHAESVEPKFLSKAENFIYARTNAGVKSFLRVFSKSFQMR